MGAIGGAVRPVRRSSSSNRRSRAQPTPRLGGARRGALPPEARSADMLVKLLVDSIESPPHPPDWDMLLRVARRGGVLVRAANRLAELGVRFPHRFAVAVADERHRVSTTLALARRADRALYAARGRDFMFVQAFRDYPDMPGNIDVLTLAPRAVVHRALTAELCVAPVRAVSGWLAGLTIYRLPDMDTALDVHHGRVGFVGEHRRYPVELLRARRRVTVGGTPFHAASPTDLLVLQGIQRVYGRRRFPLADAVHTMCTARDRRLDWNRVLRTARETGTLHGLSCYLSFVDQVHRRLFDASLLPSSVADALPTAGWGDVEFRDGHFRFSGLRTSGRLYLRFVAQKLGEGDWRSAARVGTLVPVAALLP